MSKVAEVEIDSAERIEHSPCLRLAVRLWQELLDLGRVEDNLIPISEGGPVVYATDGAGAVVGLIHYYVDDDEAWIMLGGVDPAWRGRGVYSQLYADLRELLRDEGVYAIYGATHPENKEMLAAMRRSGRELVCHTFRDTIRGDRE